MKIDKNYLIGMIQLPPLLSYEQFEGMATTINKALQDLDSLERGGFNAALIANEFDFPYTVTANAAQISSISVVTNEVVRHAKIPIGVQILLNDWESTITVAKSTGAEFVRQHIFVDDIIYNKKKIHVKPAEIIKFKNKVYPEALFIADLQESVQDMVEQNKPLIQSATEAVIYNIDAVVIRHEHPDAELAAIKKAIDPCALLVSRDIDASNIQKRMQHAHGAIIGHAIQTNGRIDYQKVRTLRKLVDSKK